MFSEPSFSYCVHMIFLPHTGSRAVMRRDSFVDFGTI